MTWRNVIPKKIDHEHRHQCTIIEWAATNRYKYPELAMLYAVPNAGKRTPRQGAYYKAEGLKPGQPDLTLPAARRGYHALYIEEKVPKTPVSEKTYPSKLQKAVLRALAKEGNLAVVCWGQDATIKVLEWYLDGSPFDLICFKNTTQIDFRGSAAAHLNSFKNVEVYQAV